eukprot:m51a1_g7410 hypothetical protein (900) ;mRNA; r:200709-205963
MQSSSTAFALTAAAAALALLGLALRALLRVSRKPPPAAEPVAADCPVWVVSFACSALPAAQGLSGGVFVVADPLARAGPDFGAALAVELGARLRCDVRQCGADDIDSGADDRVLQFALVTPAEPAVADSRGSRPERMYKGTQGFTGSGESCMNRIACTIVTCDREPCTLEDDESLWARAVSLKRVELNRVEEMVDRVLDITEIVAGVFWSPHVLQPTLCSLSRVFSGSFGQDLSAMLGVDASAADEAEMRSLVQATSNMLDAVDDALDRLCPDAEDLIASLAPADLLCADLRPLVAARGVGQKPPTFAEPASPLASLPPVRRPWAAVPDSRWIHETLCRAGLPSPSPAKPRGSKPRPQGAAQPPPLPLASLSKPAKPAGPRKKKPQAPAGPPPPPLVRVARGLARATWYAMLVLGAVALALFVWGSCGDALAGAGADRGVRVALTFAGDGDGQVAILSFRDDGVTIAEVAAAARAMAVSKGCDAAEKLYAPGGLVPLIASKRLRDFPQLVEPNGFVRLVLGKPTWIERASDTLSKATESVAGALNLRAEAKSHHVGSLLAAYTVDPRSPCSVRTVERITFVYTEGSFSSAYRRIELSRAEYHATSVSLVSLTSPDADITSFNVISDSTHWEVRWEYALRWAPSTATFVLAFDSDAVLCADGLNRLSLTVVGTEWAVPVRNVTATIAVPWGSLDSPKSLALIAVLCAAVAELSVEAKSHHIGSLLAAYTVDPRNHCSVHTVERITFVYTEGSFSSAYRTIELSHAANLATSINFVSLTSPDADITAVTVISDSNHWEVRWEYAQLWAPSTATFVLAFDSDAVLCLGGLNRLSLTIVGTEWAIPVHNVTATIALPWRSLGSPSEPYSVSAKPIVTVVVMVAVVMVVVMAVVVTEETQVVRR